MPEPTYVKEGGLYVFYLDGARVFETPEVAFLWDRGANVLLKHGRPEVVHATHKLMQKAFLEAGGPDLANDLVILEAQLPVEALNNAINITGYLGRLYASQEALCAEPVVQA